MNPLRVSVLVDLVWRPGAGGHVKTWERVARAAAGRPDALDLTVHFSGSEDAVHRIAANVRLMVHPPVFSTALLPFLRHLPDHTDLAPYHPHLARALGGAEVVHTTDTFAFARTAARFGRRTGTPMVHSVHTDTAAYARVYTEEMVKQALGGGRLGRLLLDRAGVGRRAERAMRERLAHHLRQCAYVLVNRSEDRLAAEHAVGAARVGTLRRGVDRTVFGPGRRDRRWLADTLGIPADQVVVLFVGRLDRCKSLEVVVEAVQALVVRGRPVHLVCAGEGALRGLVEQTLGARATCLGLLPPDRLAIVYASADLFAFPSETEVLSNAINEALCSGLPALVSATNPSIPASAGLLVEGTLGAWVEALDSLVESSRRRIGLARAALAWSRRFIPTWAEVLEADLLSTWRAAVALDPGSPPGPARSDRWAR
jgi:glycosyltransferase involved in cell wall biosynthesis